jgi:alpha-glucosidase
VHDRNQPELAGALADLRALVDEAPGRMTVGELFDGSFPEAAGFCTPRHLIFDWALIGLPWSARAFAESIARRDATFGPDRWPANVLSNHDQPRHVSRYVGAGPGDVAGAGATAADSNATLQGSRLGDARAKVLAAMLLTLRGTPFLYYGEELGLRSLSIPNREAADPPARRASFLFPWWNRDQARGPMPWQPGPTGGFTTGRPWLPLPDDVDERNVASQDPDPDSILSLYRRLIRLRRESPPLGYGTQELVDVGDPDVLAYRREADGRSVVVALNFASRHASASLPTPASGGPWRIALSTHPRTEGDTLVGPVTLSPLEALIAYD